MARERLEPRQFRVMFPFLWGGALLQLCLVYVRYAIYGGEVPWKLVALPAVVIMCCLSASLRRGEVPGILSAIADIVRSFLGAKRKGSDGDGEPPALV